MIEFHLSPRESARFGLRIGRATIDRVDEVGLALALRRNPLDFAILRLPSCAIDALDALRRYGFNPIIADTLVSYEVALESPRSSESRSEVIFRPATRDDAQLLESMTREIFDGYVTHYHANPLFAPDKILDGYAEWAASHLDQIDGAGAWIVEHDNEIVGFSCYRIVAKDSLAIGVLNGILPRARGRGNYRAMLRGMLEHFAALGLQRFSIATQIQNSAVQRTWTKEGLTLREVSNTVHIHVLRAATPHLGAGQAELSGTASAAGIDPSIDS
jgi:GNAT superfamily N-acetyltransferase